MGKMILRLIDEPIMGNPEKIKKVKGSKPSLSTHRKNKYSIQEKMYDRFQKFDPPYSPSRSGFGPTFKCLKDWDLITEDPKREKEWKTTDAGHICNTHGFEPSEYYKIYLIWGLIAFRALQGIWKKLGGIDPSISPIPSSPYDKIPGITAEDMFKYPSRIRIPHNLFKESIFTEEEIRDHIRLLVKRNILIQTDNSQYILSSKYYKFVVYVYIFLVRDIQQTMNLRWKIISPSKPEERTWYQFWYGVDETKDILDRRSIERSNYKSHLNLKDLRGCREKIRKLNNQIIRDHEKLRDQATMELNEIPGFALTLLSHVCPTGIIELLKKINNTIS